MQVNGPLSDAEQERLTIELGFRSRDVERDCIAKAQEVHSAWMALAADVNLSAQRLLHTALSDAGGREVASLYSVATRLFIRSTSSFQAALILAERGMPAEALSLVRACFENAILIGAMLNFGDEAMAHLDAEEQASARGRLRLLAELLEESGRTDDDYYQKVRQASDYFQNQPKLKSVGLQALADQAGLRGLYLHFRQLSANSAHASLSSIHRHLWIADGEIEGLQVGPDLDALPAAVALACYAMVATAVSLGPIIDCPTYQDDFVALDRRIAALGDSIAPKQPLVLTHR